MIKLENVSTNRLMGDGRHLMNLNQTLLYVYELLFKYDVRDYQTLKDILDSGNKDFECVSEFLNDDLSIVQERIDGANELGIEPVIYTFDGYGDSMIDDKTLEITDKENNGSVLLCASPMQMGGARINQLKYMSINQIKHLLGHLDSNTLLNALASRRNFGVEVIKRVVDRVQFYDQQVLRQAKETQGKNINLFMLNKAEKDEIVESQIKDIVEYIVDNASQCVWGKLTDTQKKRMMRAVLSTRGEYTERDRRRLINAISNYTTLGELEQGVIRKRILDRFIVR